MSRLNTEVIAPCKPKIFMTTNNLDLWIALLDDGGFVLLRVDVSSKGNVSISSQVSFTPL